MSDTCQVDRRICDIFIGDAIQFNFQFGAIEEPENIEGAKLYFTMKLDRNSEDGLKGDLQHSVTFLGGIDSEAGKGEMLVPSSKTIELSAGSEYFYDFRIVNNDIPQTLGSGTVYVRLGSTKATT